MSKVRCPEAVSEGLPGDVSGPVHENVILQGHTLQGPSASGGSGMENVAVELKKEIDIFERGRHQADLDTTGGEAGYGLEVNKNGLEKG